MNHNSLLLPCSPDLSRFDGHKLCPIREGDASAHCWGGGALCCFSAYQQHRRYLCPNRACKGRLLT
jgi:hypothetical protein